MSNFAKSIVILLIPLFINCADEKLKVDWEYINILQKMDSTSNTLGRYTHSRFDKDSLFVKSQNDFSLGEVQRVLPVLKKLDAKYDSLLVLAEQYDTLPKPTLKTQEKRDKIKKHLSFLVKKEQQMRE